MYGKALLYLENSHYAAFEGETFIACESGLQPGTSCRFKLEHMFYHMSFFRGFQG